MHRCGGGSIAVILSDLRLVVVLYVPSSVKGQMLVRENKQKLELKDELK